MHNVCQYRSLPPSNGVPVLSLIYLCQAARAL